MNILNELEYIIENINTVRLYRGLENKFDPNYNLTSTDAPHGYCTWTDNPELAKKYAGTDGYVYYIDLPKSEQGDSVIDENPNSETYGDRTLFFFNDKSCGLDGICGKEFLVYVDHDLFDISMIKEYNQ